MVVALSSLMFSPGVARAQTETTTTTTTTEAPTTTTLQTVIVSGTDDQGVEALLCVGALACGVVVGGALVKR